MGRWIRSERPRSALGSEEGKTLVAQSDPWLRHCQKHGNLAGVHGFNDLVHYSTNGRHGKVKELEGNSPKRFWSRAINRARRAMRIGGRRPPIHVRRRLMVEPEHERREERARRPRRSDAKLGTSSILLELRQFVRYSVAEKNCPSARLQSKTRAPGRLRWERGQGGVPSLLKEAPNACSWQQIPGNLGLGCVGIGFVSRLDMTQGRRRSHCQVRSGGQRPERRGKGGGCGAGLGRGREGRGGEGRAGGPK